MGNLYVAYQVHREQYDDLIRQAASERLAHEAGLGPAYDTAVLRRWRHLQAELTAALCGLSLFEQRRVCAVPLHV